MLARDRLSLSEMSWILVKVFFGCVISALLVGTSVSGYQLILLARSSYLGFVSSGIEASMGPGDQRLNDMWLWT